ncbi:MAG: thioesterase family protein [Chloroflexota bacterium]
MTNIKLPSFSQTVLPEWIDHNGHMNVAFYVLAFDYATDEFYEGLNIGLTHQETGFSVFTLGMNVDYLQELFEGDPIRVETVLVDCDHKRVHYIHLMYHAEKGFLAATNECLGMHVGYESRKSEPFPQVVQDGMSEMLKAHQTLELPPQVGRKLGIRRK